MESDEENPGSNSSGPPSHISTLSSSYRDAGTGNPYMQPYRMSPSMGWILPRGSPNLNLDAGLYTSVLGSEYGLADDARSPPPPNLDDTFESLPDPQPRHGANGYKPGSESKLPNNGQLPLDLGDSSDIQTGPRPQHGGNGCQLGSESELSDDSKTSNTWEIVVQLLTGLASRVGGTTSPYVVDELHAKAEEMEAVLKRSQVVEDGAGAAVAMSGALRPSLSVVRSKGESRSRIPLPTQLDAEAVGHTPTATVLQGRQSPDSAVDAVVERLNRDLMELTSGLRTSREDTKLVLERVFEIAEAAAERVTELEREVVELEREAVELEEELASNESDLRNLRIALHGIEVLCPELASPHRDPETAQNIADWKSDSAKLRAKVSAQKEKRRLGRLLRRRGRQQGRDEEGHLTASPSSIAYTSTLGFRGSGQ